VNLQPPGKVTPGRFLSQYWQKKPLLARQAVPAFAGIVQSSAFGLAARGTAAGALHRASPLVSS